MFHKNEFSFLLPKPQSIAPWLEKAEHYFCISLTLSASPYNLNHCRFRCDLANFTFAVLNNEEVILSLFVVLCDTSCLWKCLNDVIPKIDNFSWKLEPLVFVLMALKQKLLYHLLESFNGCRFYSSRMNWDELRPFILERIKRRNYPVRAMIQVACDVVKARALLIEGVSALIRFIPIKACKFCPELFIGHNGHLIQTCHGPRRRAKNQEHTWINGTLNDILVPVESFHIQGVSQDAIKHDQRFDIAHFPAVLELCCHAGANVYDESLYNSNSTSDDRKNDSLFLESLSRHELTSVARLTLEAWERLRAGVEKLLLVYPAKVCKCCSEVHIGPSGHKIRQHHGVFKYEGRQGTHLWKKAKVDDLVPPKVIWRQRSQDPPVLLDEGRDFYGRAPAVIELCLQAGASIPAKYFCMMKIQGLPPPPPS